jgi:hypothetical protein
VSENDKRGLAGWLGLREPFDYSKARWLGPVLSGLVSLLFILAIASAGKMLGVAVFGDASLTPGNSLGIGAVTVALIGAPFVIWRSVVAQKSVDVQEQGHITDRINKAVEGLGAEKTVDRIGRPILFRELDPDHGSMGGVDLEERITAIEWQRESLSIPDGMYVADEGKWQVFTETHPNLEVRIGAIYALERISQDSARDHIQIMEILCAYIRQNAPVDTAKPLDVAGAISPEIYARLKGGSTPRVDIQAAISVIARRKAERVESEKLRKYRLDLRDCNLQNVDFGAGAWENAIFDKSSLDQAMLAYSNLENASFDGCSFEKTDFKRAILTHVSAKRATFRYVRISEDNENVAILNNVNKLATTFDRCRFDSVVIGNDLHATILSNSTFIRCQFTHEWFFQFDDHKDLKSCQFHRCSMRNCNFSSEEPKLTLDCFFSDGSVQIATSKRPSFWPEHHLSDLQFKTEWRKWQADPENYTPPEAPDEE